MTPPAIDAPPERRYEDLQEENARLGLELERLEAKFQEALRDLGTLRGRWQNAHLARDRAMRRAWADLDHRWFFFVLAGAAFFSILCFYAYSHIGFYHDQTPLPAGPDPVLARLPIVNLVPVLNYGWLLCHMAALYVGVVYQPRRLPYFLSTIGLFVLVRSVFVALNPYGAPPDMINLNAGYVIAPLRGVLAFDNEFFFSGHTSIPYLYFLFCGRMPRIRLAFLAASAVMGVSVLLTRNHYAMDVLGAYFMTYAIYRLSRYLLGWLDPLADRNVAD